MGKLVNVALRDKLQDMLNDEYIAIKGENNSRRIKLAVNNDYTYDNFSFYDTTNDYLITNQYNENEIMFFGSMDLLGQKIPVPDKYISDVFIPIEIMFPIEDTITNTDGTVFTNNNIEDMVRLMYNFVDKWNAKTISVTADYLGVSTTYNLIMQMDIPDKNGLTFTQGDRLASISIEIGGTLSIGIEFGTNYSYYLSLTITPSETDKVQLTANGLGRKISTYVLKEFSKSTSKHIEDNNIWSNIITFFYNSNNSIHNKLFNLALNKNTNDTVILYATIKKGDETYMSKKVVVTNVTTSILPNEPIILDVELGDAY